MDLRPVIIGCLLVFFGQLGYLVDGTTGKNARGFELSTTTLFGLDGAFSVDGVATGISGEEERTHTEHQQHVPTFLGRQGHRQSVLFA